MSELVQHSAVSDLVHSASVLVAAGGLVVVVLATGLGHWRQGLAAMLDLFLAAGLLRLAGEPGPSQIAAAGAVLVVRRVVNLGLRIGKGLGPPEHRLTP